MEQKLFQGIKGGEGLQRGEVDFAMESSVSLHFMPE
jgi:hypothetical protein